MNTGVIPFYEKPFKENAMDKFDKKKFTETISDAHVDLVTVFAKCHH